MDIQDIIDNPVFMDKAAQNLMILRILRKLGVDLNEVLPDLPDGVSIDDIHALLDDLDEFLLTGVSV